MTSFIKNTVFHLKTAQTAVAGHQNFKVLFSFRVFSQVLRYGGKCSGNLELTTPEAFVVNHFESFHKVLSLVRELVIKPKYVLRKQYIKRIVILLGFNNS